MKIEEVAVAGTALVAVPVVVVGPMPVEPA